MGVDAIAFNEIKLSRVKCQCLFLDDVPYMYKLYIE